MVSLAVIFDRPMKTFVNTQFHLKLFLFGTVCKNTDIET